MADTDMQKIGSYAFLLGVVIAIVAGIFVGYMVAYAGAIALVLVILGIIVGFLNIGDKETTPFLVAVIALLATGAVGHFLQIDMIIPGVGTLITGIVSYIAVFVSPAAVIVSLKSIYNLAKEGK